jgi:hypothetical protein
MKYCLSVLALLTVLASCNSGKNPPQAKPDTIAQKPDTAALVKEPAAAAVVNEDKYLGIYTGEFAGSPISIVLNYISGRNVSGYNVHKGLKRNIRGTLEPAGPMLKFTMREPGNNKYDGIFNFYLDSGTLAGRGRWTPMVDSTQTPKDFTIAKKKAKDYDPLNAMLSDSLTSQTLWLKEDGSAEFAFYQNDSTKMAQQNTILGNWQQKGDSVIVFWQKNERFPARRTAFFIRYGLNETPDGKKEKYFNGLIGAGFIFAEYGP